MSQARKISPSQARLYSQAFYGPHSANRNKEGPSRESNLALLPAANQMLDRCGRHQHKRQNAPADRAVPRKPRPSAQWLPCCATSNENFMSRENISRSMVRICARASHVAANAPAPAEVSDKTRNPYSILLDTNRRNAIASAARHPVCEWTTLRDVQLVLLLGS